MTGRQEQILAEIKFMREDIGTNEAKIETNREEIMARMDANQERMNASLRQEIRAGQEQMTSLVSRTDTQEKKMDALISGRKNGEKRGKYREDGSRSRNDAIPRGASKALKEEAAVIPVRGLRKRRRD
jgi:hypothetical protein